ncbi:GNAT family N-acetyltransferase [Cernens ardua]|uniref:GNAT family N-acetyltransferase n=1 Tax=Cernens ardua TaxID=3402176 RepID=UPI003F96CD85
MAQGLSTTWVLPDARKGVLPGKDGRALVAAYFTLSQHCVEKEALPTTKSLPRYPIPVALLARLAVDVNYQGKGLGSKTLVTALRKACYLCSVGLPAIGLVLDVLDEDAMSFYNSYDFFEPMKDNPNRLFIGMDSIRDL